MTKPTPQTYGLSPDELPRVQALSQSAPGTRWLESLCQLLPSGGLGKLFSGLLFWLFLWPFFFIGLLLSPIFSLFPERDRQILAYRRYASDLAAFEHTQREYWLRLDGSSFEREVAALLRRLGHAVQLTGGAGDGGVDLLLDDSTVVQCKAHRTPISPTAVRDLLGAKHDRRATHAILICTSGFTRASRDFASRNGIEMWDADTLIELNSKAMLNAVAQATSVA